MHDCQSCLRTLLTARGDCLSYLHTSKHVTSAGNLTNTLPLSPPPAFLSLFICWQWLPANHRSLVQPLPARHRIWGSANVDQITTDWTPHSLGHITTYDSNPELAYHSCLDKRQTGGSWRVRAERRRTLPQGETLGSATSKAASAIGFQGSWVSSVAATAPGLQQSCKDTICTSYIAYMYAVYVQHIHQHMHTYADLKKPGNCRLQ